MYEWKIVAGTEKFLRGLYAVDIKRAREEFEILHFKDYKEKWMEDKEYTPESAEKVLNAYIISAGKDLDEIKKDKEIIYDLVKHLQNNTGISLRTAAELLKINRETLRKIMSYPPSP